MKEIPRRGDWFVTYTGKKFWPLDPHVDDICIEDIAHHLSLICRFGGACRELYSVAQHSMVVCDLCPGSPFRALMHDATEAYVGDMVRPLKYSMPQYRLAEEKVWLAICCKFDIHPRHTDDVKHADNVALMTERRDLFEPNGHRWEESLEAIRPDRHRTVMLPPKLAERRFLQYFHALKPGARTDHPVMLSHLG